jgi:hypothetical protein
LDHDLDDEQPPKRKPSKLPRLTFAPVFSLSTERAGNLDFFHISMDGMKALEERGAENAPDPAAFMNHLMMVIGRHRAEPGTESRPLTEDDIAELSAEERAKIASGLLEGLHLQSEPVMKTEAGPDGTRVTKIDGYEVVTPREEGEDDEAYLQRAWKAHNARLIASWKKTTDAISKQLAGLSAGMRDILGPGLLANFKDSHHLSEQLSRMASPTRSLADQMKLARPLSDMVRDAGIGSVKPPPSIRDHLDLSREMSSPSRFKLPDIPTNPIYETNSLLEEMGERIAGMHEVSRSTASMQQSLNEVARDAVALFAAGAEDARKAGEQGLSLSVRALWVGIISAALSVVAIGVTVWSVMDQAAAARSEHALEARRHQEDTALRERELAASERLAEEIRRLRGGVAPKRKAGEGQVP